MFRLPVILLAALLTVGHASAELPPVIEAALCDAAAQESAVPAQFDALLEGGLLEFDQVEHVITLRCDGQRSMLELLVQERRAENLEYLVVDMGLDIHRPLSIADRQVSLKEYLTEQVAAGSAPVREFASEYLELFADKDFNPGLWLSMQ